MKKIKNVAIIAHVDHGKTTLIDALLRQSGLYRDNQTIDERVMDSNDIEKERGITIFSKNASIPYKDIKINIVDTPGHADFGGEVQRIIKMVDSVLLVVDAFEGPMPQTRYVLKKALSEGHCPIVVINKIDRPDAQPETVVDKVFDLFVELQAADNQLDFPVIFASAKDGVAHKALYDEGNDMVPLFNAIVEHVKEPEGDESLPFQFLVSAIDYDNYIGRLCTGKIANGVLRAGDDVCHIGADDVQKRFRVTKLLAYQGLQRVEVAEAFAGDVVTIAGIDEISLGDTLCDIENPIKLESISIDEPTIAMTFSVNDSPFMGREGDFVSSRHLTERLNKELKNNVSMRVEKSHQKDSYVVKGRGELQLSILIENMRREGYEFQVSRPQVIMQEVDGKKCEPIEHAVIDVADEFTGVVIEKMGLRKAELMGMNQGIDGYSRLEFKVPARGLIGFRNEFLTETKGTGILNHSFHSYEPFKGALASRSRGVLVAMEAGISAAYAIFNLQDRGIFFIDPGTEVYEGMIVGEHNRDSDLVVNICKTKKLTNMRASGSDENVRIAPARKFSLEQALEYIQDDELLEITPQNVRLRKKILNESNRRKAAK
ncbi:MAG: translational GTPase TypA [Spirochaetes bacterium]|jgi:GTP-binding protein|nr:translational GTPase TypA [Spirochaetota bacterium]